MLDLSSLAVNTSAYHGEKHLYLAELPVKQNWSQWSPRLE